MELSIYQVDAFTNRLFGGNPAAICPLDEWLDLALMQKIAMENNLSETAFFVKKDDVFEIRWFTPEVEIDLCGHATLASAHVIFNHLKYQGDSISFQFGGGQLRVDKGDGKLRMNFPASPAKLTDNPMVLIEGLGIEPDEVYKSRDFMAVFNNENDVLVLKPNFTILKDLDSVGIIVTAPGREVDFISRFFAPAAGIDEDPVTGSAHCTLIPYWSKKLNKTKMKAEQASKRGGVIYCEMLEERVIISGEAITYMQGKISL